MHQMHQYIMRALAAAERLASNHCALCALCASVVCPQECSAGVAAYYGMLGHHSHRHPSPHCAQSAANPQGDTSWAFLEGQSFLADHSTADIDFFAIHLWPDNWEASGRGDYRLLPAPCC